jgi:hypothetical protein
MSAQTVTVTRVNRGRGHAYRVKGDPMVEGMDLPSVTTVLGVINKPALVGWARNDTLTNVRAALEGRPYPDSARGTWPVYIEGVLDIAKGLSDATRTSAADYGIEAHDLIQRIIEGKSPKIPKAFTATVDAFARWRDENQVVFAAAEQPLYSPSLLVGGTLDIKGYMATPDRTFIADIKTGNAIYQEAWLQLCAYAMMHEEMGMGHISEAWVIRLPKEAPGELDEPFEAKQVLDYATGRSAFAAAVHLFKGLRTKGIWHEA